MVDARGIARFASRNPPAHIRMVRHRNGECHGLVIVEHGRRHSAVIEVGNPDDIGVVSEEGVAWTEGFERETFQD